MYLPGDYFRGGLSRSVTNKQHALIQDYMQLLIHLDQRQSSYANPNNRPNSHMKLPVQNSFEEWWDSEDEELEEDDDRDDDEDCVDISDSEQHTSELFDSKKRPASCHWSPNPRYQNIVKDYKKQRKTHYSQLPRPTNAPLDEMNMTSPQITLLKQKMYTFFKYHSRHINTGLHIFPQDASSYDIGTVHLAGFETKPTSYSAIKSVSSRWFEYYWGVLGEEYLYDMQTFNNNDNSNQPLRFYESHQVEKLSNLMLLGMPQNNPFRFDDHLTKMMYQSKPKLKIHDPIFEEENEFDPRSTDTRLSYARRNINYTIYHRYILQTLFHIAFDRRDWDMAFKLYGTLTLARSSNRLNSWPMGMEVLRNQNYRNLLTELESLKPVGDIKPTNVSNEDIEILTSNEPVHVPANTLHLLAELRNSMLLPLMLNNNIKSHSSFIRDVERLISYPSSTMSKIGKLYRHFSRSERGRQIIHYNGPETAFMLPNFGLDAIPDDEEEVDEESTNNEDSKKLNSETPNYNFKLPASMKKVNCFNWDYHVHYRTGNVFKLSPSVIAQVNFLLINGKFDQARELMEVAQKGRNNTAEAGLLLIEINVGDILSKISEVMVAFNADKLKAEKLLKEIDDVNNDTLDLWARWKDQFGYNKRGEGEDDMSMNDVEVNMAEIRIKKQRREFGMENWEYVQELLLRLGVWIEFVKQGGKVGLGTEVFGDDWNPVGSNESDIEDEDDQYDSPGEEDEDHDHINPDDDEVHDLQENEHYERESDDEFEGQSLIFNRSVSFTADIHSDDDDMEIVADEFDENDPRFLEEMEQLMSYNSQAQQSNDFDDQPNNNLEEPESTHDSQLSFEDEFNSDNSGYQREMSRYSQYSQKNASHEDNSDSDELANSTLDDLSD